MADQKKETDKSRRSRRGAGQKQPVISRQFQDRQDALREIVRRTVPTHPVKARRPPA